MFNNKLERLKSCDHCGSVTHVAYYSKPKSVIFTAGEMLAACLFTAILIGTAFKLYFNI